MKITLPLKTLKDAVEKSSVAALTKEVQDEARKKIRPTDACVKISANKGSVVFESSSPEASALYSGSEDDGVSVEREGSFCVDARRYLNILRTFGKECTIQVSQEDDENYRVDSTDRFVRPVGKVTTTAVEGNTPKRGVEMETYPVSEFIQADYAGGETLFTISANLLKECVGQVAFATDPTDQSGVYSSVAIFVSGDKIHFAGTDGKRCAIFTAVADEKDAAIILDGRKILLDGDLLKKSCRSFDDGEVVDVVGREEDGCVMLASERLRIRLHARSEEITLGFPNFVNILGLACPAMVTVDKAELLGAIKFLCRCNPEKSIIRFEEGKPEIRLEAARMGPNPPFAIVACEQSAAALANPVAVANLFVADVCGKIKGDKVRISFSRDEKKVKMESPADERFVYFFQACTLPIPNNG